MLLKTGTSVFLNSPTDLTLQSARCRHFGTCGGCSSQGAPYEDEWRAKLDHLRNSFKPLGLEPSTIHPSPDPWFYRNKMEFSFGREGDRVVLGLKAKGQWRQVLSLKECFLLSLETPALLRSVEDWAAREKLGVYDSRSRLGLLRHLVVREAKNGGGRMVLLVSASGEIPEESFKKAVLDVYPASAVLCGINDKLSDTAIPDSQKILFGGDSIQETLRLGSRSLQFRVSSRSFFQSNTRGSEILHSFLREKIRVLSPKLLLDLYCGIGAITLSIADLCEKVIGLECVEGAVLDAIQNAQLNQISNVSFYSGFTEILLPALLAMRPDCLIVDPPRSGIHPRALGILEKSDVPAIFYVSCNPKTLLRDLEVLRSRYQVKAFEAFDFFPHTEHVETAVFLLRH